jgi:hypothetical protein
MESTMKPGTAKIMTEYPEVGKLYRVYPLFNGRIKRVHIDVNDLAL